MVRPHNNDFIKVVYIGGQTAQCVEYGKILYSFKGNYKVHKIYYPWI